MTGVSTSPLNRKMVCPFVVSGSGGTTHVVRNSVIWAPLVLVHEL